MKNWIFKKLYFLKLCPIFVGTFDNFGKSEDAYFHYMHTFMSNLIKKSWKDSSANVLLLIRDSYLFDLTKICLIGISGSFITEPFFAIVTYYLGTYLLYEDSAKQSYLS